MKIVDDHPPMVHIAKRSEPMMIHLEIPHGESRLLTEVSFKKHQSLVQPGSSMLLSNHKPTDVVLVTWILLLA